MSEEKQKSVYIVPGNYDESVIGAKGIKTKNLTESCVAAGCVVLPTLLLPIVWQVKAILIIFFGVPLFVVFFIGKNNCSMMEYLKDSLAYSKGTKVLVPKPIFERKKRKGEKLYGSKEKR